MRISDDDQQQHLHDHGWTTSRRGQDSPLLVESVRMTDTIRYDTRCYFNVRSKADISQLNLPHGNRQLKSVKNRKIKKTDMLRSKVNSLGNPYSKT